MKYLIYSDVHFSEYSSIFRTQGIKYSQRLENLIASINWAESLADKEECDKIIILGDFFDKPILNARELTALSEIKWSQKEHICIVGNHEADSKKLTYNSLNILRQLGFTVIDTPIVSDNMLFLPYDKEANLNNYISDDKIFNFIFSHNDIKGVQYGKILTTSGVELDDIKKSCKLFLNGHIHNGGFVSSNAVNIGNLTGSNFTEDAFTYAHQVAILSDNNIDFFENPYACNFYKIDLTASEKHLIAKLKPNSIVSFTCYDTDFDLEAFRKELAENPNILLHRITIKRKPLSTELQDEIHDELALDHIQKFKECCREKIGNSILVEEELEEISR